MNSRDRTLTAFSVGFLQKVGQQLVAGVGQHAFGVKLHPLQMAMFTVTQAHDLSLIHI